MAPQKINLQDPLVKIIGLSLVILILTGICAQKFIIKPQRIKISAAQETLTQIKLATDIAKLKKQVAAQEKDLPPQKESTWLLTEITRLAQQAEVDISSIQPLPQNEIPPYIHVSFKVDSVCTYEQLLKFIQFTEASRYLILIESIDLEAPQSYKLEFTEKELNEKTALRLTIKIVIGTVY